MRDGKLHSNMLLLNRMLVRKRDLLHIDFDPSILDGLKSLMTPREILDSKEFDKPLIISPEYFKCFEDLLDHKKEISNLGLVPVKHSTTHERYKSIAKDVLEAEVTSYIKDDTIAIYPNKYPYWLSNDVNQRLVWSEHGTADAEILDFIARIVTIEKLELDRIVMFERPLGIDTALVRGTLPRFRHIHLWTKYNHPVQ